MTPDELQNKLLRIEAIMCLVSVYSQSQSLLVGGIIQLIFVESKTILFPVYF